MTFGVGCGMRLGIPRGRLIERSATQDEMPERERREGGEWPAMPTGSKKERRDGSKRRSEVVARCRSRAKAKSCLSLVRETEEEQDDIQGCASEPMGAMGVPSERSEQASNHHE